MKPSSGNDPSFGLKWAERDNSNNASNRDECVCVCGKSTINYRINTTKVGLIKINR